VPCFRWTADTREYPHRAAARRGEAPHHQISGGRPEMQGARLQHSGAACGSWAVTHAAPARWRAAPRTRLRRWQPVVAASADGDSQRMSLPIFPLNVVALPTAVTPLLIFEPRCAQCAMLGGRRRWGPRSAAAGPSAHAWRSMRQRGRGWRPCTPPAPQWAGRPAARPHMPPGDRSAAGSTPTAAMVHACAAAAGIVCCSTHC
jgi:hypothetical protein